jgi:hypothetical protein
MSDIDGFTGGGSEVYCLIGCDTVYTGSRMLIMKEEELFET